MVEFQSDCLEVSEARLIEAKFIFSFPPPFAANCGIRGVVSFRCSRCRNAWFCGSECQAAYWPLHKPECKVNEFADIIESTEPKFATWMRNHGKLAQLKDDEVHRLERAQRSEYVSSRQELESTMYGRLRPTPVAPTYSPSERRKVDEVNAETRRQLLLQSPESKAWETIIIPPDLGTSSTRFKWRQNQTSVEVFLRVPPSATVTVELTTLTLTVRIGDEDILLGGELSQPIKRDESMWYVEDRHVLTILLRKRYRRGYYEKGKTNAETFWYSIFKTCHDDERLNLPAPPVKYYWTAVEFLDDKQSHGTPLPLLSEPKQ